MVGDNALSNPSLIQIHRYDGVGYQPLVFSGGWQAAILNWEPPIDLANLGEIERHAGTDEAFVLWRGRAALYVAADRDVENRDTHLYDTEIRAVTAEERRQLIEKLPEWARQKP